VYVGDGEKDDTWPMNPLETLISDTVIDIKVCIIDMDFMMAR
jgi:hypothetical protein